MKRAVGLVLVCVMAFVAPGCAGVSSFEPVTSQGAAINNLFWLELAISAVLFAGIVGVIVTALVRFRGRAGDPDPPQVEGNTRLEVLWTATPAVILAIIFVLVVQTMTTVNAAAPNSLNVEVVGHQFWWEYRFPDQNAITANELHLPVGTPVLLRLSSNDVIHSFWVPQFGWMRDAVPGRVNLMPVLLTQAATVDGGCNQFCGAEHAWMRELIFSESNDQFQAWLANQAAPAAASDSAGERVFMANTCVSCHAIRGTSASATVGPDLTHVGSRTTLAGTVIQNTPDTMSAWISNPQAIKPGVLMPAFPNLSAGDLAALSAYLEGLK
ncbi:MAG: cytochrome c oxidase subunit II [Chloroflexi bacterium]|nr:cytochrome c oxidase subunit II [Chloroflexota bacterium]